METDYNLKCIFITLLLFPIFTEHIFSQQDTSKIFHPLSNAFGITLEGGGTVSKTDYEFQEVDIAGRLLLEYFFTSRTFSAFGLRLSLSGGFVKGEFFNNDFNYPPVSDNFRTGFFSMGGGLVYAIRLGDNVPYFSVGMDHIKFNPKDKYGFNLPNNSASFYKKSAINYLVEAGIRFPFADLWSLNLAANLNLSNTDYLDDVKAGKNNDAFISCFAGISFYIGKNTDRDNDGVDDDIDFCPNTSSGIKVDEFGCSVNDISPVSAVYDTLKDTFISDGVFTDGKIYSFQIEVFNYLSKAELLQRKILSLGYNADIIKMYFGNISWYSVRIGYFSSFEIAKFYKENFFKKTKFKLK